MVYTKHLNIKSIGGEMEQRKIIQFGNSSFVVSLPKDWMQKNSLKKGDSIYLLNDTDNSLKLTSEYKEIEKQKEIVINLTNKDVHTASREIFSAYVNNYSKIKIVGNNNEDKDKILWIRKELLTRMIGLEVLEQTSNSLVIHDLLDFKDISLKNLLKRAEVICNSMLSDSIGSIETDSFESIYQRDIDINRISHLVHKIVNTCLENPSFLRKMGITYRQLFDYWVISDNLEKFADESKRISRLFVGLNLKNNQKDKLISIYREVERDYLDVMKAYYKRDKKLAYEINNNRTDILNKCDKFFEKNHNPVIGKIIEKMKSAETFVRNISRVVINEDG